MLLVIAWGALYSRGESLLPLTAVLRSLADRFGARPIDAGYAGLRLFVQRPPRTLPAAQRIDGAREIPTIAARLVNAPIWTFWRDLNAPENSFFP